MLLAFTKAFLQNASFVVQNLPLHLDFVTLKRKLMQLVIVHTRDSLRSKNTGNVAYEAILYGEIVYVLDESSNGNLRGNLDSFR